MRVGGDMTVVATVPANENYFMFFFHVYTYYLLLRSHCFNTIRWRSTYPLIAGLSNYVLNVRLKLNELEVAVFERNYFALSETIHYRLPVASSGVKSENQFCMTDISAS